MSIGGKLNRLVVRPLRTVGKLIVIIFVIGPLVELSRLLGGLFFPTSVTSGQPTYPSRYAIATEANARLSASQEAASTLNSAISEAPSATQPRSD